jgi:exonuclease SbcD
MKVLAIPDLHCFYDNYSRVGEDGIPSRLSDFRQTSDAVVRLAVRERVDVAVAPGDYFVNPRPAPRAIIEVARMFSSLEEAGITVVGCNGNHDTPGPGQPGPVDVIATLGRSAWGITSPQVVVANGLQVAVLPWAKPSAFIQDAENVGDANQRTSEALLGIAHALSAQLDHTRQAILIGHWAVAGCQTSSGQVLFGEEPTLPLSELQALPFQAVIMGHIHKPQLWTGPGRPSTIHPGAVQLVPPVIHTGALTRRDFGEENDPRGAYIVDLDTREVAWHDLPTRRFLTIDLEVGDENDIEHVLHGQPTSGAIVRARYRANEEEAKRFDHGAILKALHDSGAYQVAGIFPEVDRGERGREASITESTGPIEALEKWLQLRSDISGDLRAKVMAEAATLLEEVQA